MASYDKYVPYALQMERDTGIPAAIILGQAMLEGGSSLNSGLVRKGNNFFGIKGTGNAGAFICPPKNKIKTGGYDGKMRNLKSIRPRMILLWITPPYTKTVISKVFKGCENP